MAFAVVRHHDAFEAWMSGEAHSEQVEHFTLKVVGCGPYRSDRFNDRTLIVEPCFETYALFFRNRQKMVDNFETRLRWKPIHCCDIAKIVERTCGIIAQDRASLADQ